MTALGALWLSVLLSSVFVFLLSSIVHMLPLWHQNDYPLYPGQDRVLDALRPLAIPRGDYLFPRPSSRAEMKSPEFIEKTKQGPVVIMTVIPHGPLGMGRALALWFVYIVVVNFCAAYIASRALAPGAPYLAVFRFAGTTAFFAYSLALWQMSIWYGRAWSTTIKATVDGLIYGCVVAGTFGWLWPR
ncbi:MAG TPA: hypothetical protein VF980_02625 [Thermoanaerobaculia bacterium]